MQRRAHQHLGRHLAAAGIVFAGAVWADRLGAVPAATGVASLKQAYGVGVHAYFDGRYEQACENLTQAIEAGSQDPRALYFRGLAERKLGRLDEAEADFSAAAMKEAKAVGDWDVSRSLERVQGGDRLAIERHRFRARLATHQLELQGEAARYVRNRGRQPDVRRQITPEASRPDNLGLFTGEDEPAGAAPGPPAEQIPPPGEEAGDAEPAQPAEDGDGAMNEEAGPATPDEGAAGDEPAAEREDPPAEAADSLFGE